MDVEAALLDDRAGDRVVVWALASAGFLGLVASAMPGMPGAYRAGLAAAGVVLFAGAGLVRLALTRFGRAGLYLLITSACLVVAVGLTLAGGGVASAVFGVLLCWPVLAAALLVPWRQAAAVAATASAVYGGALAVRGVPSAWWAWVVVTATLLVGAVVASALGARLRQLATTDTRTGAVAPRFWEEMVSRECARAARTGHPLCIAVVSVDGVEDHHRADHLASDEFMRRTVHAWTGALRGGDLLTPLQNDEFGVLLPECGDAAGRTVVDRLRHATPDGRTTSAGIAMWTGDEPPAALVNRAWDALEHARRAGRDQSFIAAA